MDLHTPEKVYVVGKISRLGYYPQYLGGLLLIAVAGYAYSVLRNPSNAAVMYMLSIVFLIGGIVLVKYVEVKVWMKSLKITNHRVILEEGFFSKKSITLRYSNITELTCNQSFIGRILGFGDITIHTAGGKLHDITIEKVGRPLKIKAAVEYFTSRATPLHPHLQHHQKNHHQPLR